MDTFTDSGLPWDDDYGTLRDETLGAYVPDDETLRAVAFVDKGGTSKTTSLAHMGVVADQELGLNTLLIALDGKQNDLATHFGIEGEDLEQATQWPTIAQAFAPNIDQIDERPLSDGDTDDGVLADLAMPTGEGPDLIPASEELDGVDKSLSDIDDPAQRYSFLDDFLSKYVDDQYDLVLIDVPAPRRTSRQTPCGRRNMCSRPSDRRHSTPNRRRRSARKSTRNASDTTSSPIWN